MCTCSPARKESSSSQFDVFVNTELSVKIEEEIVVRKAVKPQLTLVFVEIKQIRFFFNLIMSINLRPQLNFLQLHQRNLLNI